MANVYTIWVHGPLGEVFPIALLLQGIKETLISEVAAIMDDSNIERSYLSNQRLLLEEPESEGPKPMTPVNEGAPKTNYASNLKPYIKP